MDRKLFFTLIITLLLGGLSFILWQIFEPFITALLWAVILVTVTYPLYRRLLTKMPQRRELAAALMCLGLTLLVVLPLSMLLLVMIRDLRDGSESLSAFLKTVDYREVLRLEGPLFDNPIISPLRGLIDKYINLDSIDLRAAGVEGMQRMSQFLLARSKGVLGALGSFVFTLILTELSMFFLFRDGPRFLAFIKRLIPLEAGKKELIFGRMREVVQATIFGSLGTAVVQGFIGGVLFLLVGLPSAVLWAAVMTLSSFLPLVGTSLVWGPAALWFLADGHWGKALLTVAGGVLISTVDNFIRPVLIRSVSSQENQLNTLVLFMSVLGGIKVFGFLGIVLGPLLVVLFLTLLELLYTYMGYDFHALQTVEEDKPLPLAEALEVAQDAFEPDAGIAVAGSPENASGPTAG
ncbi:MAG: AI-2E family transporter [Candidatus Sericytochromatia bacterium]